MKKFVLTLATLALVNVLLAQNCLSLDGFEKNNPSEIQLNRFSSSGISRIKSTESLLKRKALPETVRIKSGSFSFQSSDQVAENSCSSLFASEKQLLPATSMQLSTRILMMGKHNSPFDIQLSGCEIIKTGTAIFSLAYTAAFLGYYFTGVFNEEPRFIIRIFDFDLLNFFLNAFIAGGPAFFSHMIDCSGNPEDIKRYNRQAF